MQDAIEKFTHTQEASFLHRHLAREQLRSHNTVINLQRAPDAHRIIVEKKVVL